MKAKYLTIWGVVLVLLLMASYALAQQGPPGRGQRDGETGRNGPRPMFGELISIDGDVWTLRPELPEFIRERIEENGRELPRELPDEISVTITDKTKFHYGGEPADAAAFSIGDMVVVVPRRSADGPVAARVADAETAREFIGNMMGDGSHRGQDRRQRPRPAFGMITSITGEELTLKPEVPQFVLDRLAEAGIERNFDLPEEITVTIGDRTRFVVAGELVDELPFAVGDSVAVMGGLRGGGAAMAIADYATVELHMLAGRGPGGDGPPGRQQDSQGPPGQQKGKGKDGNRPPRRR